MPDPTEDPRQLFERLTRQYARLMTHAIRRVCGRRHGSLVSDVEQEVYLALWKRLEGGKEIRHPASYLYKVALCTALATLRKLGPAATSIEEVMEQPSERRTAGASELEPAEQAVLIRQALETLDADQAQAVRAWLAGFNHVEVAELFGWSESVARHRIYRGLERLRATLGEQPIDGR